jgi:hypothetical protein
MSYRTYGSLEAWGKVQDRVSVTLSAGIHVTKVGGRLSWRRRILHL